MDLYSEFFSVIKIMNDNKIKYAVVGGIALSFYAEPRYTKNIDFLVLPEDIDGLKSLLKSEGYIYESPAWDFKKTPVTLHRLSKIEGRESMTIDILVSNEKKYKDIIEDAVTEQTEFGEVSIVSRRDLIWMKKIRNSKQDIADIEALSK